MGGKKLTVAGVIGGVIGLVILFTVAAELYPELDTAGDTLNASGIPLGSIFADTILGLIVAAALVYTALRHFGVVGK